MKKQIYNVVFLMLVASGTLLIDYVGLGRPSFILGMFRFFVIIFVPIYLLVIILKRVSSSTAGKTSNGLETAVQETDVHTEVGPVKITLWIITALSFIVPIFIVIPEIRTLYPLKFKGDGYAIMIPFGVWLFVTLPSILLNNFVFKSKK